MTPCLCVSCCWCHCSWLPPGRQHTLFTAVQLRRERMLSTCTAARNPDQQPGQQPDMQQPLHQPLAEKGTGVKAAHPRPGGSSSNANSSGGNDDNGTSRHPSNSVPASQPLQPQPSNGGSSRATAGGIQQFSTSMKENMEQGQQQQQQQPGSAPLCDLAAPRKPARPRPRRSSTQPVGPVDAAPGAKPAVTPPGARQAGQAKPTGATLAVATATTSCCSASYQSVCVHLSSRTHIALVFVV